MIHYQRLDDDLFPELKFGPGRKGIHALMPAPPGDPRVPAAPAAKPLLVVFRLEEPQGIAGIGTASPGWQLAFDLLDANGTLQHHHIPVLPQPMDGNATQRPSPDTGRPSVGTVIYRGAWWADLASLYRQRMLRPGGEVILSFADQAHVKVMLA